MPNLSIQSRVKINDEVLFQELQGEAVLLDLRTGVYFGLDRVGTRVWQLLGEHGALSTVVGAMLHEFDVDEQRCAGDLLVLTEQLREQGLISVE
jgi:hypothetical protein